MTNEHRDDNWLTLANDLPSGRAVPLGWAMRDGRDVFCDSTGDELWEIDPDGADVCLWTETRDLPASPEPWSEGAIGLCLVMSLWVITLLGFWLAGWLT